MGSSTKIIQHAIVTYARSWSSLATVRSLGERGVRITVGDTVPLGAASFSKYCLDSFIYPDPSNEKEFIDSLIKKSKEIYNKYGGKILLLPIHEESYIISKFRNTFPKYINIVLPENNILQKIQNKGELIKIAKKHNVTLPPSWYIHVKKALKIKSKITYPVYIKIPTGSGSIGIYKIENKEEFENIIKNLSGKIVIQSYVEGKDYCCCALFDKGKPIALITYTALQTYPVRGGTSVYRKTVNIDSINKETIKLLSKLNWDGVAEIDFRVGDDKKAYLIEVNPRFWGGLNHAIKANIDFPYLVWKKAQGHKLKFIKNINNNVKTGNFVGALNATIEEITQINLIKPSLKKFLLKPNIKNLKKVYYSILKTIPAYRKHLIDNYLKRKSIDDIYDPKDPKALAGLLFPLAIYFKYGKINEKLLISSSPETVLKELKNK